MSTMPYQTQCNARHQRRRNASSTGFVNSPTAEQETDQIVAPQVSDVSPLLNQFATAVNAVPRLVSPEVDTRSRARRFRIAWGCDLDQRAGLWVAGAEYSKLRSVLPWEDH